MADRWLIVGNSPVVKAFRFWIAQWQENGPNYKVATINTGHALLERPDLYFLADPVAIVRFGEAAAKLRERGTRIVSITGRLSADEADELIDVEPGPIEEPFTRGRIVRSPLSGLYTVQLIANLEPAPEHIHLLGFEGYRSTVIRKVPDTWDGINGNGFSGRHNESAGELLNSIFRAMPATKFFVYGEPAWKVSRAANVVRIPSVGAFPRLSA